MKRELSEHYRLEIIRRRDEAIARGGKKAGGEVVKAAAAECCMSYSNMTRRLKLNARTRSLDEATASRIDEKDQYARKVWDFVAHSEADGNRMRTGVAYRVLRETGETPDWVTLKMVRESIRRNRWKNEALSVPQIFRGRHTPLHMAQLDSSKSKHFQTKEDGRIVIAPSQSGKNIQRLMIGGAVDDFSRVMWFRYYRADGESEGYVRDLVIDMMSEKEQVDLATGECRRMKALMGMPKQIYADRGSGHISEATKEGLKRMNIDLIVGANEKDSRGVTTNRSNKKGRGKIERRFQEVKYDFESYLNGLHDKGLLPPEITLDWLNAEAGKWIEAYNSKPHPEFKEHSKWDLFEPAFESIQYPADDARALFTRRLTAICRNRLFDVPGGKKFIAPKICDEGVRYEIEGGGNEYYLWRRNQLIKLEPQTASSRDEKPEVESDLLEGIDLRERFGQELRDFTGGELMLRSLPDELSDDWREFRERARTIAEIRLKVRYFAEIAMRRMATNVIEFQKGNQ